MSIIKLDEEEVEYMFENDGNDEFDVEYEGGWISERKKEYSYIIFKDKKGKFWRANASRSGRNYTDWCYNCDEELREVEKKEVTKTEWEVVE